MVLAQKIKLGKNIIWSNLNHLAILVFGLISSVYITRVGGKEVYGEYMLALSFISIFVMFSLPGIRSLIVKYVSQGSEGIYRASTIYSMYLGMIFFPLSFGLGLYLYINTIL